MTLRSLHAAHADLADLADGTSFASGAAVALQVHHIDPHRLHGWNVLILGPPAARGRAARAPPRTRAAPQVTGHLVYEPSLF
ncbi:hypothetical protein ACFPOI_16475 [Nonomuraea angiospora]|uniref:Uncharacterized protein n=1 Tax=Nonomuraea angiospora TaxID=46172 RepID=A0ABR9MH51_9ACTN|nr:hypothetical protein [Nonomuraea angiospora]MBE1592233.1 hypothetical protein [Nonomuraea angiospora]